MKTLKCILIFLFYKNFYGDNKVTTTFFVGVRQGKMSNNVEQRRTMSNNVEQCRTMSYNVEQCRTMSNNVVVTCGGGPHLILIIEIAC